MGWSISDRRLWKHSSFLFVFVVCGDGISSEPCPSGPLPKPVPTAPHLAAPMSASSLATAVARAASTAAVVAAAVR